MSTVKENMKRILEDLPEDATWEDAAYKMYFMEDVEKGIQDADQGRVVSTEEAKKRLFSRFNNTK